MMMMVLTRSRRRAKLSTDRVGGAPHAGHERQDDGRSGESEMPVTGGGPHMPQICPEGETRDVHDRQGRPVPRVALFQGLRLASRCRRALEVAGVRAPVPHGGAGALQEAPAFSVFGQRLSVPRPVVPLVHLVSRAASRVAGWTTSPSGVLRYAVAAAVVLLAAAVTLPLWQAVFIRNPFALFYAAVIVAAWFGGLGPGLLATLLAVLTLDYLFVPSLLSSRSGLYGAVHVGGFAFVSVLVSSLEATRKRAMADMGAAKEAAEESARVAESANRAKDQFLAVLSHELRTPLTPALAAASAMEADGSLPSRVRGELGMVRRNIELEARLIDDLLDLTRVTRGKLQLSLQAVNLNALIGHVADICRFDLRAKWLSFNCEFGPDAAGASAPYVNADPARLRQVLWNVLKNAIKFTPAGGSVTLRTRLEPSTPAARPFLFPTAGATASAVALANLGYVLIEIIDTGIGIEPEVLPKIFDAFEQGDRANSHAFGGLGLGLAISRALVVAHGGELTAFSEGTGLGATFTLRLPLTEKPAEADAASAALAAPLAPLATPTPGWSEPAEDAEPAATAPVADAAPRRLRVLLVEDHPDTARVMARLLRSDRHDVTVAYTAGAALEASAAAPFDLIISDLGLPDGNGLDLLRELREEHHFGGRAIALSGYGMEEDLRRSRDAGFAAHLTKPVNFDSLEAVIREVTATAAP
jgi:two-component system CheB/CheR fusion protein